MLIALWLDRCEFLVLLHMRPLDPRRTRRWRHTQVFPLSCRGMLVSMRAKLSKVPVYDPAHVDEVADAEKHEGFGARSVSRSFGLVSPHPKADGSLASAVCRSSRQWVSTCSPTCAQPMVSCARFLVALGHQSVKPTRACTAFSGGPTEAAPEMFVDLQEVSGELAWWHHLSS